MNTKTWIIFGAVVVLLLGGLIFTSRQNQVDVSNVDINKIQPASDASGNIADHVKGNPNGKVTIIEYGDFQCPGCAGAAPVLEKMSDEFKDDVAFVYRNNPLTSIHPNAKAAASAAEAAGLQGRYWEMHRFLFAQQDSWKNSSASERASDFETYARQIGVKDMEKFKTDMGSDSVSEKINFDLSLGKKAGVSATPTILVDGKKIESDTWGDETKFRQVIEDALK